ncbi:endospore germination permease [Paenibacillus sp. NPDC056579]|uniref:endospore germination permease n=1 Tax=Paenibacillus sp. NPDC056579 TaxID=3345871 RepID=UPI0036749D19
MAKRPISVLQVFMMLMLVIGENNHVLLLPFLLETAKRDSWMVVIIMIIPAFLWTAVWNGILKKTDSHLSITCWIQRRYGKMASITVAIPILLFLLVSIFASIRDTAMWTHTTYLPLTPIWVTVLSFVILCFFAAAAGIEAIAICAGILLPFVVVLGFFVMTANVQNKDYSFLTPLFTHGMSPTLHAMPYMGEAIGELMLLLFFRHHVKTDIRLIPFLVLTFILLGLTIGPLMGAIAMFGPFEAAHIRYPAFEQWRMVSIGKFISHLDFFSVYQWMSGAFIRVSLMLFLVADIISFKQRRNRIRFLAVVAGIMVLVNLIPLSDMVFMRLLKQVFYPGALAVWLFLTVVIGILVLAGRKEKIKTSS